MCFLVVPLPNVAAVDPHSQGCRRARQRRRVAVEAAIFGEDTGFDGASFKSGANFVRSRLNKCVSFEGATFNGPPIFDGIVLTMGRNAVLGLDHNVRQLLP